MRGVTRGVVVAFLLLLLIGVGFSQSSRRFAQLGVASVYAEDPDFVLCAGALMDVYHIYSTAVGVAVSTVTFSTQKYAFGCAQLDVVTVATTSTVTQATTTTETQTVTTGTTVTTVVSETVTLTTGTTTQTITQTQETTQTVTTGTTATVTQTKTTVSTTTTVLQVQVQEGVYALLALLLGSTAPLLIRAALKAQRIYRERRVLRDAGVLQGSRVQDLNVEDWEKREKGGKRVLR
jgi:hypothetical protein